MLARPLRSFAYRLAAPSAALLPARQLNMAPADSHVTLHTGAKMPKIGLGTWAQTNMGTAEQHAKSVEELRAVLRSAIDAGYRHIDTAWAYKNEKAIGDVLAQLIKEGVVKRSELFITTKLYAFHHAPEKVEAVLREQLKDLQMDYLDMYLMHSPVPFKQDPARPDTLFPVDKDGKVGLENVPHLDTWKALEACVAKGLTKHIGVSNFNSKQIQRLLDQGSVPVANLQVECHAYFPQKELKAWCDSKKIAFTAYSPIGSPGAAALNKARGLETPILLNDPVVAMIAEAHQKSPAQTLIRYLYDRGCVVIPKSTNPQRIKANLDIFDFSISQAEIEELNGLARGRLMGTAFAAVASHPEYPYNEPF